VGTAIDSMVSPGAVVSGGTVRRSVLSPGVRVHSYATVEGSVLLHDVDVGRGAVVRRAILDKNVKVPEAARGGRPRRAPPPPDRERYRVSEGGVVVLAKGQTAEV
jgi:glucose-1-phosphate adenylyltransferase